MEGEGGGGKGVGGRVGGRSHLTDPEMDSLWSLGPRGEGVGSAGLIKDTSRYLLPATCGSCFVGSCLTSVSREATQRAAGGYHKTRN